MQFYAISHFQSSDWKLSVNYDAEWQSEFFFHLFVINLALNARSIDIALKEIFTNSNSVQIKVSWNFSVKTVDVFPLEQYTHQAKWKLTSAKRCCFDLSNTIYLLIQYKILSVDCSEMQSFSATQIFHCGRSSWKMSLKWNLTNDRISYSILLTSNIHWADWYNVDGLFHTFWLYFSDSDNR